MKMYNEKGNAKRAAKGLADKYPSLVNVIEPIRAPVSQPMWYAAVQVKQGVTLDDAQRAVLEDVAKVLAADIPLEDVVGEPEEVHNGGGAGNQHGQAKAIINANKPNPKGTLVGKVSVADALAGKVLGVKGKKDKDGNVTLKSDGRVDLRQVVNMPKTQSTPAEVKARREARKAAPAKPAKGPTKTEQALGLIRRKGGATAPYLREQLEWGTHTLRGWVSLQNSVNKRGIATLRKDGVTTYFIPDEAETK